MSILSGITQVGAVIEAARDVIEALKPSPKSAAQQASAGPAVCASDKTGKRFLDELSKASLHFIRSRDSNGNGSLDVTELGLGAQQFRQWDLDGDGALTVAELNQAYLTDPGAFSGNGVRLKV